jgi:hypothetical protein
MEKNMSKAQTQVSAPAVTKIEKRQTNLRHVFLIDWDDAGIFKEVAVVKEDEGDGTINQEHVAKVGLTLFNFSYCRR